MMTDPEREARMALSVAMDGGDPAVAGLVVRSRCPGCLEQDHRGCAGRSRRPSGRPAPHWRWCSGRPRTPGSASSSRVIRSGRQGLTIFVMPRRSSGAAGNRSGCGCADRVTWRSGWSARWRSSGRGRRPRTAPVSRPIWPRTWSTRRSPWSRVGRSASTRPRIGARWPRAARRSAWWPTVSMSPIRRRTRPCSTRWPVIIFWSRSCRPVRTRPGSDSWPGIG